MSDMFNRVSQLLAVTLPRTLSPDEITLALDDAGLLGAATSQVEATLALVEQQRIANLIALANLTEAIAKTQAIADARDALVDYHQHEDPEMGGWTEFKPEIKEALGL